MLHRKRRVPFTRLGWIGLLVIGAGCGKPGSRQDPPPHPPTEVKLEHDPGPGKTLGPAEHQGMARPPAPPIVEPTTDGTLVPQGRPVRKRQGDGHVDGENPLEVPPLVSNQRVFFIDEEAKQLIAVDPARARRTFAWKAPARSKIRSILAVDAAHLIVVSTQLSTLAVDQATGKTRWTLPCTGEVIASRSRVIVACPSALQAVSADQGNVAWTQAVPASTPLRIFHAADRLHVVTGNQLAQVSVTTGRPVWTMTVPAHDRWVASGTTAYGFGTAEPGAKPRRPPPTSLLSAIDLEGHLQRWSATFPRIMEVFPAGERLVLGLSRGVMAVQARDGAHQWSRKAERTKYDQNPHFLTVHEASGTLILEDTFGGGSNYYGKILALDLVTGRERYRIHLPTSDFDGPYTITQHGPLVLVGMFRHDAPDEIIAVEPRTGKQLWTTWFGETNTPTSEPAIHGDRLYVRTERRELIAIDLRTGRRRTVLAPSVPEPTGWP